MAEDFKPGTISKFLIGSTELAVATITYNETVDVDDVTHTLAQGFQVLVGSIKRGTYTISGGYDFNANYHAAPPAIIAGQILTAVHAKPDGSDDYTSSALVTEFNWNGGPQAGAVKFNATMRATSPITRPTT